jgi:hypothetical protein
MPSTGPTGDPTTDTTGETTGEVMGECGNGEAEENELCLGDVIHVDLVCCPPTDLAIGDLDGNGDLDVATAIEYDAELHVYSGDGDGGFVFLGGEAYGFGVNDIGLGFFDDDTLVDIAFPYDGDAGGEVGVILNDGGPSLFPFTPYTGRSDHIATGDLDNDTYDDIVTVSDENQIAVLRSSASGTGTFTGPVSQTVGVGAVKNEVIVAEFNNNANLDVAVALSSDQVGVCLGNGNGGFTGCNLFDVGPGPVGLAAGDFNGDGDTDIATSNEGDDTITILFGQGNGGFDDEVMTIDTGERPIAVAAGDLDNDGTDDIATVSNADAFVYVYRSDGDGGFTEEIYDQGDITLTPEDIALGDINADGALDIVVGNATASVSTFGLILSEV